MQVKKLNLIGKKVKIVSAANKALKGIKGRIIDETKNTLTIETEDKIKKVLKKEVKLRINTAIIDGEELIGRPEERLKKKDKVKSRW
ncbi:ribonuclease P protein subunit [archaeon]|nr:ribonuclease P protein subunit [archaeon]